LASGWQPLVSANVYVVAQGGPKPGVADASVQPVTAAPLDPPVWPPSEELLEPPTKPLDAPEEAPLEVLDPPEEPPLEVLDPPT
jgi:hypothetical protein